MIFRAEYFISQHKIISQQITVDELVVVLTELNEVIDKGVVGDIVEFGCYAGTTSLFIRRYLDQFDKQRQFHVYDSFAGLPQKSPEDLSSLGEDFKISSLKVSKKEFITNFKKANLKLPIIHKSWFSDLSPDDLPETIAFAFLDGDFYLSIQDSLKLVWPKLSAGARVVIHDYGSDKLPGVKKAVDQWVKTHNSTLKLNLGLAIIQPRSA